MARKRPDRRVGRSKRLFKEALLELIQEHSYEELTIGQIAERADVGRSTFYSHFTSKDDLLFDGFDLFLMSLAVPSEAPRGSVRETARAHGDRASELTEPETAGFNFSLPLLRHIRSQRKFFLATIIRTSASGIRSKVIALFVRMIRLELETGSRELSGDDELAAEARGHAIAGAFLTIAGWWLEHAPRLSAEFVDREFAKAVRRC